MENDQLLALDAELLEIALSELPKPVQAKLCAIVAAELVCRFEQGWHLSVRSGPTSRTDSKRDETEPDRYHFRFRPTRPRTDQGLRLDRPDWTDYDRRSDQTDFRPNLFVA